MLDRRRDWAGAEPWLVHAAVGAAPPWEVPAENLVAFADSSGSSDYQLLACDDHLGRRVFAFEHAEGLLTPTDLTLLDFLKGAWNTAKPKLEKLTPRHWSVQFSVSVRSEQQADLVLARIAAVGDATIATAPVWTAQFLEMPEDVRWPTTPVSYYERRLQLAGEQVSVRKVPGHAEAGSKLVFTLSDPETELDSGRVVSVRRLLSDLDVTFVECDYGLL
ncbi:MAG TPA: hypothetical protein VNW92_07685 [Polyangiaceae bacterium]|nr:hypothetical protein [Polyangiaceae bacterium]